MSRFDDHLKEREAQNSYASTKLWTPRPHLAGMIGEREMARFFGAEPDLRNKPQGDGGVDLQVKLRTANGARWFDFDSKGSTYGDVLRVDVEVAQPQTVYVLVFVNLAASNGKCVGWQWGRILMDQQPINWCGNGTWVYAMNISHLRKMLELSERFLDWRHPEMQESSS